jgi:hypothetical protein
MKQTNPETLRNAIQVILNSNPVQVAREASSLADGIDTKLGMLSNLASVVRSLAILTSDDEVELANSYAKAMEYGDALHTLLLARSASEYACHIDDAEKASNQAQADANELSDKQDEPTTAKAYAKACSFYGV